MKKTLLIATAVATYLITPVWAEEARTQRTYTEAEKAFRKADIVNDGRLDRGEYDIYAYQSFLEMDQDRDKVLTASECLKNCFKGARGKGKAECAQTPPEFRQCGDQGPSRRPCNANTCPCGMARIYRTM